MDMEKDFGQRVKYARQAAGLSQHELAMMAGYASRSSIAKIESGERDITRDKIVLLAKATGVTPAYLMGWESTEPKFKPSNFQDELEKFIDRLDPSAGLAFFNGEAEMDEETRELILMSLKNTLLLSQKLAKNKEKENED